VPESEAFLRTVLGEVPSPGEVPERLTELDGVLRATLEPMLGTTISPTMISASQKRNVVPALCEVVCDCRLLPDVPVEEAERAVRQWLGEEGYELSWIEAHGGTRSSFQTPLWDAIESFVAAEEPGARVAPVICPGFTDSHWVRDAFGTIAYGFFPLRTMDAEVATKLVHSADERIAIDDLELGVDMLRHAARSLLG
jgi:acetylornithine deacetylase/succinyl-diaminopimelate desuccinylase-like protein